LIVVDKDDDDDDVLIDDGSTFVDNDGLNVDVVLDRYLVMNELIS
jgi:hypothetical protein